MKLDVLTKKNFFFRFLIVFTFIAAVELSFSLLFPSSSQLAVALYQIVILSIFFVLFSLLETHQIDHLIKFYSNNNPEFADRLSNSNNAVDEIHACINQLTIQKQALTNDLTELKNITASLRNNEQRYRKLIETLPDATLLTDNQGSITLANNYAVSVLGVGDESELLHQNIYSFIPPQEYEHFSTILNQVAKKRQIQSGEVLMLKKDASLFFTSEVSISALYGTTDEICELIMLIRDISERKKSEAEKAKLEEQFRSIYKMEVIGQLAGGIAHDFNNILGAISGYGDIILLRYQDDERLTKYARMILSAAGRASDLTKKLLTFSRKSKLQMEIIDVHKVIQETVDFLERTLDKNIKVRYVFNATNACITGDASQIQSAIINLAINSRDAMSEGGEIFITTENSVLDEKLTIFHAYSISPGSYLAVSVRDTGEGMDQRVLSHLFEPFFTTKDIGKGTGLGLASVYGTVKSHNGYIDVKSEPGQGSTFTLYIPDTDVHTVPVTFSINDSTRGKGNVLIVDDEGVIRDAVKEILAWLGYSVYTCTNGLEAVDFYQKKEPVIDLIILDMIMPGINGKECFTKLKSIDSNVKVILSTGYRIDEERQSLLDMGIIDILDKPFVSAQLAQSVHSALSQ
ncbi:MAG TPA: response regulator [Chitinispirillaceae bacterium]|nr:response regulator [Chitinispirillaceae bacterium]